MNIVVNFGARKKAKKLGKIGGSHDDIIAIECCSQLGARKKAKNLGKHKIFLLGYT